MFSNRLAFIALGLASMATAAGGGYLATRHNVADHPVPALTTAVPTGAAAAERPVAVQGPVTGADEVRSEPSRITTSLATTAGQGVVSTRAAVATTPPAPPSRQLSSRNARDEHAPASADRGWAPSAVPAAAPLPPAEPPAVARFEERTAETPRGPEPPEPTFDELTVAADSVIGLRTETTLSSERARVEDRVEARVVRDVRVGGRVAIAAGTRALGSVVVVERGGKMRDRARLGIRFNTLALADGTRLPISTETIYRYGDAPSDDSAKKIGGGAVAGAILGAILGGGKGAAIGATTGAAGGSAVVMAGDRSEAVFPSGADVTARMLSPVTITIER